jgi:hypothetical protein
MNSKPPVFSSADPKELTPLQLRCLIRNAEERCNHLDQQRRQAAPETQEWRRLWTQGVVAAERLSLFRQLLALETRVAEQASATPVHAS